MITTGEIFWSELNKYAGKYQFSFQFLGEGNNNVYIMKDDVDLFDTGGLDTPREALKVALEYIYKINRVPHSNRVV